MLRGITAAWDIRSEMTENRDRPEMACPYFVRPARTYSKGCKSLTPPLIVGRLQPKARVSAARRNLKEAGGKHLV